MVREDSEIHEVQCFILPDISGDRVRWLEPLLKPLLVKLGCDLMKYVHFALAYVEEKHTTTDPKYTKPQKCRTA